MSFRTSYDRSPVDFECTGESLTRQEFEAECNINNILARFNVTGVLIDPSIKRTRTPLFGDFSSVPDYGSYHAAMLRAKEHFDSLPLDVRMRFGDDPTEAMRWLATNPSKEAIQDVFAHHSKQAGIPTPAEGKELDRGPHLAPGANPSNTVKDSSPSPVNSQHDTPT